VPSDVIAALFKRQSPLSAPACLFSVHPTIFFHVGLSSLEAWHTSEHGSFFYAYVPCFLCSVFMKEYTFGKNAIQ